MDRAWIAGFRTTTLRMPFVLVALCAGCTSISIQPSCPNELAVGESGRVAANELNPGAIATYFWQAFPADAGTFADPTLPTTTFQAAITGEVVIRLTASDGLYQVISSCVTSIVGAVAVSLTADVTEAEVGEPIELTCTSIGASPALGVTIVRDSGAAGTLTEVLVGTSEFVASESGEATFSCTGIDISGELSDPVTVTVTITAGANGGNGNDNTNDNTNDNGGGRR